MIFGQQKTLDIIIGGSQQQAWSADFWTGIWEDLHHAGWCTLS
jgi:hypothetical protein